MKKIALVVALFAGCGDSTLQHQPKYFHGEWVKIKVNGKHALVTGIYHYHSQPYFFRVRYSDDMGILQESDVQEYEIETLNENTRIKTL